MPILLLIVITVPVGTVSIALTPAGSDVATWWPAAAPVEGAGQGIVFGGIGQAPLDVLVFGDVGDAGFEGLLAPSSHDAQPAAGGFVGDADVMDTWATSSLTPQIAAGWRAGGQGSVALGYRTTANNDYAVALGYRAAPKYASESRSGSSSSRAGPS